MIRNFAHRGYSAKYPENTLLAFRKAIDAGCDGIVINVQLSRDGFVVVFHDETLERTTNGKGAVADYTLQELQALNAGAGQTIPTLESYFQLASSANIVTIIECNLPDDPKHALEKEVLSLIAKWSLGEKVIIASHNYTAISHCKQLAPHIEYGLIVTSKQEFPAALNALKTNEIEFLHPNLHCLDETLLKECHKHNLLLNVGVVNTLAGLSQLANEHAVGLITNDPALIAGEIGKWPQTGYTDGVYDLFHVGHLNMIRKSRAACEKLIVGVHGDDIVEGYKHRRPIINENDRREIIGALKDVDAAMINTTRDKTALWHLYHFDLMLIGDDWKGTERWNLFERQLARLGVKVIYLPYTQGISSTEIIEKIKNQN